MTESDDTKWIICGLGIAIIAFFTFIVFKTTNQVQQPMLSVSAMDEYNKLNLLRQNQYVNQPLHQNQQNQFQLIEQKLQQLENKIDGFNTERKTVSMNGMSNIGNNVEPMNVNRFSATDHKLIQRMFDMK